MVYKIGLILCFIVGLSTLNAQNYTISGYVSDNETGEKMIGASVFDLRSKKGTTTNTYGYFSITLPSDSVELKVSYVGYRSSVELIHLIANQTVNFNLNGMEMLDEIEISASESIQDKTQMSTIEISMEKVKSLPVLLGEQDIIKTIQLLPGVQSGSEGGSGMYVRGGGPDQNLILLDGVPVYNASHLFGFFSVFNADAINNVTLIKGGFPAHYGGRLSSVIDISMKEGNNKKIRGEGSIGLIASKLMLEGPIIKDKTSFIVSARRTYLDLLTQPIVLRATDGGALAGYYFYDLNAKVNHVFSDKSRLYLSGYLGNDRFYQSSKGTWDDQQGTITTNNDKAELLWGNKIAALRWNYILTPKLFSNTTITYSKYRFKVGVESETNVSSIYPTNNYYQKFKFAYNSGIEDYSGKIDFDYTPHPDHYVKFGMGLTNHLFTPGVNNYMEKSGTQTFIDTAFGATEITAQEYWAYVEDDFKINDKIKVNLGLHYSGFFVNKVHYHSLQPRVSGRYLINEDLSIKASYARMAQYLHLLTNTGIGLPTDLWVPPTDKVLPQFADQVAAGFAQTLLKKFEFSIEGYYKRMLNLIEYKDGATFLDVSDDWQTKVEAGKGWSYGGEFLLEKKNGKTTGWIGYTLSWTNRQFENVNFGEIFPYRYDRRHDIGIAITHKFNERVDVGFVWVYGTGTAVTLGTEKYMPMIDNSQFWSNQVIHIEERNNFRMPSYHRLDLGINFHKQMKWGERTWSFGLYNAYSRQNPFYIYFARDFLGNNRLAQISLFPIIPSFSYNFKF